MRWWKKRYDSLLPYVPHLDYETTVRGVCYNKTALPSCLMGDFFLYTIKSTSALLQGQTTVDFTRDQNKLLNQHR